MSGWVAAATVASAAINSYSSNKAAGKMAAAGKDPFGKGNRVKYQGMLSNLMANPNSILQDPIFQSATEYGMQGVARQMASQGFLGSPHMAAGIMNYGQSSALNYLTNQEQFLATLAGAGNFGSPNVMAAGAAMGNQGTQDAMAGIGAAAKMWQNGNQNTQGGTAGIDPANYPVNPQANFSDPQFSTYSPSSGHSPF